MRRRDFLVTVGGAAAVWPLAARAQKAGNPPTIGFLGPLSESAMSPCTAAFVQRLRELGWIEGRTIAIEYRWADGRNEHLADSVAEFVRLKVAVIVTGGSAAVVAAKKTTSVIPIVFGTAADPVRLGLVASLARPEATSQACRTSQPIFPASDLRCCVVSSPACAGWLSWLMSRHPLAHWK